MSHLYRSEHNKTRENKHYVAVKNLNSLLKDKNKCSEHFCINCLKPFRTKQKLKNHNCESLS